MDLWVYYVSFATTWIALLLYFTCGCWCLQFLFLSFFICWSACSIFHSISNKASALPVRYNSYTVQMIGGLAVPKVLYLFLQVQNLLQQMVSLWLDMSVRVCIWSYLKLCIHLQKFHCCTFSNPGSRQCRIPSLQRISFSCSCVDFKLSCQRNECSICVG